MNKTLYFDCAATMPPDAKIHEQALAWALKYFANPSSTHALGKQAQEQITLWRKRAAVALAVNEQQVLFTSGATEANQIALLRMLLVREKNRSHIVASSIEHPSVHENLMTLKNQGFNISWVAPKGSGHVDEGEFVDKIDNYTRMVVLMLVNNETGAIEPVKELIHEIRLLPFGSIIHIHVDATQACARMPLNINRLGCDSVALSTHKMGGPRGAGILYMKNPKPSIFQGGGQEFNMRAGTENMFGIIGSVLSLEKINALDYSKRENEALWLSALQEMGAVFVPKQRSLHPEFYVSSIISCAFPPLPGEVLVRLLSEKGLFINTGSACGKNKKDSLRGLLALGISEELAQCTVRISFSQETTREDTLAAIEIFQTVIGEQKKLLGF